MKKLAIFGLAALLVVAFSLPASALENQFGGYWRTRVYAQAAFSGEDDGETQDVSQIDTRTRLYYTAVINDALKFVNKFEYDAVWGDNNWGDFGSDGVAIEIKNSYAEFTMGPAFFRIGIQPLLLARGFLCDTDGAAILAMYSMDKVVLPFVFTRLEEGEVDSANTKNNDDQDVDGVVFVPTFTVSEGFTITPYIEWAFTEDIQNVPGYGNFRESSFGGYGVDVNYTTDAFSAFFTGIKQFGYLTHMNGHDWDLEGYMLNLGGSVNLGAISVRGEIIYTSGDEADAAGEEDFSEWRNLVGASHYWAEIMGFGVFDNQTTANSDGDQMKNLTAFNIGGTYTMDKIAVKLDLWRASLTEEDAAGNDDLGTEADLTITIEVVEGLNLDVIAAYMWRGDATYTGANESNISETGARLSLSF